MLDQSVNKMGTPLKRIVELTKAEKSAEMIKIKGAAHHEPFRCTGRADDVANLRKSHIPLRSTLSSSGTSTY